LRKAANRRYTLQIKLDRKRRITGLPLAGIKSLAEKYAKAVRLKTQIRPQAQKRAKASRWEAMIKSAPPVIADSGA
jgi:hypothetical protein